MKDFKSIKIVRQLAEACTTIRTTVWEHLGFELGLSKHSLAMIQTDHSNIESRCSAMLKLWLQSKADASWETLKKALRLSDLDQLASMIDQQLLTERTSPTSETKGSITHQSLSVCIYVLACTRACMLFSVCIYIWVYMCVYMCLFVCTYVGAT